LQRLQPLLARCLYWPAVFARQLPLHSGCRYKAMPPSLGSRSTAAPPPLPLHSTARQKLARLAADGLH